MWMWMWMWTVVVVIDLNVVLWSREKFCRTQAKQRGRRGSEVCGPEQAEEEVVVVN
jgi:hypothetical protein